MDDIEIATRDAIIRGDTDRIKVLFSQQPEIVHRPFRHLTWVHLAAKFRRSDIIRLLLSLGCDVNAEEKTGNRLTPLDHALNKDDPALVELLLERGANPNHSREPISAVTDTNKNGLAVIKLLERYGADLHRVFKNEVSGRPMNALSEAIAWNKQDVVDYLRSKGAVLPDEIPQPARSQTFADEVVAFFADNFGPVDKHALIEIVPEPPPVAIHFIPATSERGHITLFTTGMSNQPMNVPADPPNTSEFRFAELFIQLPGDWPYREVDDPRFGWPHRWLRNMAKYPFQNDTWLGGAVAIVDEQDPPEAIAPNVRFNSMLFLAEQRFTRSDGNAVRLYRLSQLYPEERELEHCEGIGPLLRAFDRDNTPFIVDLNRPNVAAH